MGRCTFEQRHVQSAEAIEQAAIALSLFNPTTRHDLRRDVLRRGFVESLDKLFPTLRIIGARFYVDPTVSVAESGRCGIDDQIRKRKVRGVVDDGAHEEAAPRVQALADAAKTVNPDILVLCHGGPISEPEDVKYILANTKGIVGFFGASSIERLPTEVAITGCVKQFKGLRLK